MKLGRASVPGGAKTSLSRALWRSVASLPTPAQVERLLAREVARAERNGLHFSLVLFRVRRGGRMGLSEKRLALTLLRRIRLTDEVGWFDDEHLCALLPDTSSVGARIFTDAVCDLVARKSPRPISTIYSFPTDWKGQSVGDEDIASEFRPVPGSRDRRDGGDRRAAARANLFADRMGLGVVSTNLSMPHDGNGRNGHNGNGHSLHNGNGNGHHHGNGNGSNGHGANGHNGHGHNGNGNGHGSNGHAAHGFHRSSDAGGLSAAHVSSNDGGVAVLEAPAKPRVTPTASTRIEAAPIAQRTTRPHSDVKPIQDLLVRPMPWWKRGIDILGAATALTLLSPVLLLSAAAIKLSSKGPVVFTQHRAGLGGRPFTIFKFRTMCNDAEAKKKALRQHSEQDGPAFKMERDPRVTRVGAFLRKTSIDELPQLLNVLKGDMSLVGPRPLPLDEQDAAETWQQRRLDVTPGLTCIWQIEGRSRVTFAEWVRMDVSYMRQRTIFHDIAILLKTVPAVLFRRGAK